MIETLTPTAATEILREHGMKMSPDTLRCGIEQGVYPFGLCIQCGRQPVYQIFAKLFYDWIAERSVDKKETAPLQRERPQVQTSKTSISDDLPGVKDEVRVMFGDAIKRAREDMGLTQAELERFIGAECGLVARWESGQQKPTECAMRQVARALGYCDVVSLCLAKGR